MPCDDASWSRVADLKGCVGTVGFDWIESIGEVQQVGEAVSVGVVAVCRILGVAAQVEQGRALAPGPTVGVEMGALSGTGGLFQGAVCCTGSRS